jgi:hypothetical protein
MSDKPIDEQEGYKGAYHIMFLDGQKLNPEDKQRPNVLIGSVISTIQAHWEGVCQFRDDLRTLPGFHIDSFDKLPTYVLGLDYADAVYRMQTSWPDEFQGKVDEAVELRAVMISDIDNLAKHKVLFVDTSNLELTKGYDNIASTLLQVTTVLDNNWAIINGKCALGQDDIKRGYSLAHYIRKTVGVRQDAGASVEETLDIRDRGFTLVVDIWDELRRGLAYLRGKKNDVDSIAPSLFAGHGGHKKNQNDAQTGPAATQTAPVASTATASANAKPQTPGTPDLPGAPGGSPFLD